MTVRALAGVLLALAGCAIPTEGGENAYVLLDEGARRAGLAVDDGAGPVATVRPLAITGEDTALVGADGEARPLEVGPDEVVLVRGSAGQVDRWTLGTARPDLLVATGDEESVRAMASAIDADFAPREDGRWELLGPAVYERSAALASDPLGVLELHPVMADDSALPSFSEVSSPSDVSATVRDGSTASDAQDVLRTIADATAVLPDPPPALAAIAPAGFRFTVPEPGRYAMALQSSHSGGCSRSWSHTTTTARLTLEIERGGTASMCRTQVTRSSTMTMSFDEPGGPARRGGYASHEAEQRGFRGFWRWDGDAAVIELAADDTVCGAAHDGVVPVQRWTLRCSAVRARSGDGGEGAVALPGEGLACTVVPGAWRENRGYTVALEGTEWVLLGEGAGWDLESSSGRFGYSAGVTVTRRTERPVVDLRELGFAIP